MLKAAACLSAAALALPLALIFLITARGGPPVAGAAAGAPTAFAKRDIPPAYLRWYLDAARTCPGLSWSILAAIGKVESDHGRSQLPGVHSGQNHAGAGGPMQFLAATWASYGVDADHDGRADRYNPHDAIYGAARYLCANGAGKGGKQLYRAIWHYNHADWYVRKVLDLAKRYAASVTALASGRGAVAVRAALRWLGTPYSWGGGGPSGPSYGIQHGAHIKGFDCSGLTQYAWAQAGVRIDRVAAAQYDDGPHVPRSQLQPGDLLFFAHNPRRPESIHHVGIYVGGGRMLHAPQTGDVVRIAPFSGNPYRERQYVGATRPAAPRSHSA
ncbi:NlpC/P60 family protein [Actinomadura kijaniata]|uniref:Cell wall-associated NlpC family hydrolase n=1 Tax=Actinomadura namibiensis TaxID=182080 RepID=A0A7W3QRC1_ACTNM|nr:bifunctional lytic transglycosylase/C40 family peptidase [Actinomadura namibiensis]MBA8956531.1 cell wall-associated NlpC family hydrolase [Actinomadura namibiensis]